MIEQAFQGGNACRGSGIQGELHQSRDSAAYENALLERVFSIIKIESIMEDMVQMMINGNACVVTVTSYVGGEKVGDQAFFTMGMPKMVKEQKLLRIVCPGMANKYYGNWNNNKHSIPYNVNLLVLSAHGIIINTRAPGENTNRLSNNDTGIYAGRKIWIGGEKRIICCIYESIQMDKKSHQSYCPIQHRPRQSHNQSSLFHAHLRYHTWDRD